MNNFMGKGTKNRCYRIILATFGLFLVIVSSRYFNIRFFRPIKRFEKQCVALLAFTC